MVGFLLVVWGGSFFFIGLFSVKLDVVFKVFGESLNDGGS